MNLDEIWRSLENDLRSAPANFALARRLYPDSPRDIRVAVDGQSSARMLLVRIVSSSIDGRIEFPRARGFELKRVPMSDDDARHLTLGVILTRPDHADVFTSLVQDVAARVAVATTDRQAVEELVARISRWQAFLQRHEPEGLSLEEQRGLFGELWFLLQHAIPVIGERPAVIAWTGPSASVHDFQFATSAVEVKTTASSQHQLLHIASERQLDDAGAGTLILFRLSVDEREGAGQSLVSLVTDVRSRVGSDPLALQELENKLIEAGYLDSQSHRYGSRGYTPRDSSFFRVSGDFPRITDRDLRPGVGDVRYTIAVTACLPHALAEPEAHGLIGSKHEE